MSLSKDWNQGNGHAAKGMGSPNLRDIMHALTGLSLAELKALDPSERFDGMVARLTSNGRYYRFHATSALTGEDALVVAPSVGSGRWLLEPGQVLDLALPIAFGTADAAVLYTVPTGAGLRLSRGYWEVTTGFTGGSSSAIGASSSATGHTTKGDLHGGAGGDVAATLVAGNFIEGTVGADVAAGVILKGGETVRFDRVTSAFTAGAGFLHLVFDVLANPGA